MTSIDDPKLSERIRAGDRQAMKLVAETYAGQLLNAARGAGLDLSAAEDVAQSTFQVFVERAAAFDGRSHVRTWLFGILYNKISEMRRQLQKSQHLSDIDEVVEARFDSTGSWTRPPREVDAVAYDAEVREHIESCLETLPLQQRMAFFLREVEGLSTQELCKILEVSRTNLGVLLFRARNRLRECLEAKGLTGGDHA